jgi:NTE family protein
MFSPPFFLAQLRDLIAVSLLLSLSAVSAQDAPTGAVPAPKPKVALVLSGGGARGLSHVGVIKVLEDMKVPVDMVVGTSMGAIIGGLYAAGMGADDLERELLKVDWGDVFERRAPRQLLSQRRKEEDFELSPVLEIGFRDGEFRLPTGAVSTRSLELLLRRYTLSTRLLATFDGLPTPFRAVATDMETGKAVVLDHGDLAAAMRASMSVPGVFAPLDLEGQILGDGGLVNNLPVDVARRMGADVIIAVNIGTPLAGRETLGSLLGITTQMVNILTEQNVQASIATLTPRDLLLQPSLGKLSSADFAKAPELVKIGHDHARSVAEALRRFSTDAAGYAQWQASRSMNAQAYAERMGQIKAVRFEGVPESRVESLSLALDTAPGRRVDVPQIEADLQRLSAMGDYDRVDYRLERVRDNSDETLVIGLRENDWGPNYLRLGLDLRTDFDGRGAFNLLIGHNRHWFNDSGAEWRNRLQLGETLGAFSEIYQPLGRANDSFVAAYVDASLKRLEVYGANGKALGTGQRQGMKLGADYGWPIGLLGRYGDLRLGVQLGLYKAVPELVSREIADSQIISTQKWRDVGVRAALISDQLDFANFPSSGYRFQSELAAGQRHLSTGNGKSAFNRLEMNGSFVQSWGAHTLNLGARFARATRVPVGDIDEYSLGGFQQLSGYRVGQVAGNYLLFGRMTYYQRLPWNVSVARALFAGGSLEAGNAWDSRRDISLRGLRYGTSLFIGADTGVGPLYLSVVSAPKGYTGLYLFLGRP